MANALQRLESKLEQMISGTFARAFRSAVQPVEIAAALQRECDNNAQILSRNRRLVPNEFHVELSATDLDRLQAYDSALQQDLTTQLLEHAQTQGYSFPGPITIDFESADDLTTGRFRIRSKAMASVLDNDTRTRSRAAAATLEVNGTRHELRAPGLVVGRGTEADLRINDPGVSRRHVEFEVGAHGIGVQDLGSTNGIFVNGHQIDRALLGDGDVVRIGRTEMTLRLDQRPGDHQGGAGV